MLFLTFFFLAGAGGISCAKGMVVPQQGVEASGEQKPEKPAWLDYVVVVRDLVNTKIPFIMFSYSNIFAGEIAYEDIFIASKQHIT